MHDAFTTDAGGAVPLHLFSEDSWGERDDALTARIEAHAAALAFEAKPGQIAKIVGDDGGLDAVLYGLGDGRDALAVARLSGVLTAGSYTVETAPENYPFAHIAAGWADGAYRFQKYLSEVSLPPKLFVPDGEADELSREAEAIRILRDMVNTPAADMGPAAIQGEISQMAEAFGASLSVITGDALLDENYPMVHAVGRAAEAEPRIMELSWGEESHLELAIVGKGVAFDSGGLNIKGGDGMRIMKKDMGGAAHAVALARLVMGANLPVRLKLYVPAVENAISGDAFRPGDVLSSRKGLTVEIDNTDAEGRLILGDALTRACESAPDLVIDFATLTGAARVALGPDLAPFYTDDEAVAAGIEDGSSETGDPVWRMPLWAPYLSDLKSPIADLVNSGGRMAGSITAGLFLKEFVDTTRWVHLDVWAWRKGRYGRPQGGAACGLRAVWAMLEKRYPG